MSKFELCGVPPQLHGMFYMLREKVRDNRDGSAWALALGSLLRMKDPEEVKKLLEQGTQDSSLEFPLYHMLVDHKDQFLPLQRAGVVFDSGWIDVDIGCVVIESNFLSHPMTDKEKRKISEIADEYSASK